jgi:flavin-dependent dehydrogenase
VVIWGNEAPYENEFIANPYGMGWHLDRERFDDMLLGAARVAGAEVRNVTRCAECHRDDRDDNWIVIAEEDHAPVALAPWMIDATGRASGLGRRREASDMRWID